jgi:hypothetical protein
MLYAPGGAGAAAATAIASATSSWWTSCKGKPGSGTTGFNIGATLATARTGPGNWFHGIASAKAVAPGPATIHGRRMNTSSDESLVISASSASQAACCAK